MAVTIQASIDSQEYAPNARRVYYDETADKWWVCYVDNGDIYVENSTDGTTWANQTQLNTDAGATCDKPTLCSDDTYLYVFWADDGSGDDGIHFRRITLTNSTLYPAADDGLVIDLGSFTSIHQISADCGAGTEYLWVSIPEEGEGPWHSHDSGVNWHALDSDADINTSDIFTTLVTLSGDNIMCIYDAGGTGDNDIRYKIYNGIAWSAEGTVVNDIWTENSDPTAAYRGNAVHIGSDEVIWATVEPVEDGATSDIAVFFYDGSWTQRADYATDDYYSWAIPAWDETDDTLYLYFDVDYSNGTSNYPGYDTSIDKGINWAGATTIESAAATVTGPSINVNSVEKLGVTWVVGTTLYFEKIADLAVGDIAKVDGVAYVNIAKIDGVAATDIAKIDGVTF